MHRHSLFPRRSAPSIPRCLAAATTRAFSSTPSRPYKKPNRLVDARMQLAGAAATVAGMPAPTTQTGERNGQEMAEDIGLLQNTLIRAPFSRLPSPASWEFYSYFWTLVKARFTALYTRSHFRRCVEKIGVTSYLPVDFMRGKELKSRAKKMYKRYYELLAAGDANALSTLCLPPLAAHLRSQIAARGPVKPSWKLLRFKSAKIVSHRCSPLGGDHPDTSYRQCVVRLESEQRLALGRGAGPARVVEGKGRRAPVWTPRGAVSAVANAAAAKEAVDATATAEVVKTEVKDTPQIETVVEYLVMQTRVMDGKEEEWKVWGFASESTPAKIEEDEAYWKKMLDIQAAA